MQRYDADINCSFGSSYVFSSFSYFCCNRFSAGVVSLSFSVWSKEAANSESASFAGKWGPAVGSTG